MEQLTYIQTTSAVSAGVGALAGEPLRALATTGFTLDRRYTVRRARVDYTTSQGTRASLELDPTRLERSDTPVEPDWVHCRHAGPLAQGTIISLELEVDAHALRLPALAA